MNRSSKKTASLLLAALAIFATPALLHAQQLIPEPDIIYYGQAPLGAVVQIERGINQPAGTAVLGSNTAGADGYAIRVKLVSPVTTPTPVPPAGVAYLTNRATVFVGNVAQGQVILDERGALYQLDFTNPARTPSPNAVLTPLRVGAAPPTAPSCNGATCTPSSTPTITSTPTRTGTVTQTPTPTATSTSAILVGAVDLEGHPPTPNTKWRVPLRVSLTHSGEATPFAQYLPTTDDNGSFQVDGIAPGAYEIRVKNPKTLQVMKAVTLVSGINNVAFGTLRAGDANDDNVVNLLDFSILRTTFGLAVGQIGYDPRADFNDNQAVNLLDFSLMRPNFSQLGARAYRRSDEDASAASPEVAPTQQVEIALVVPAGEVVARQTFSVDIEVRAGAQQVDGVAAYLDYDPAALKVVGVTAVGPLTSVLQNRSDTPGRVSFAAGSFDHLPSGTFTVAHVEFIALADASGSRLQLVRVPGAESDASFAGESVLGSLLSATLGVGTDEYPHSVGEVTQEQSLLPATPTPTPTPDESVQGNLSGLAASEEDSSSGGGCQTGSRQRGGSGMLVLVGGLMWLGLARGRRSRDQEIRRSKDHHEDTKDTKRSTK